MNIIIIIICLSVLFLGAYEAGKTIRAIRNRPAKIKPVQYVCAWCDDKEAQEEACRRLDPDCTISHGICEDCWERMGNDRNP